MLRVRWHACICLVLAMAFPGAASADHSTGHAVVGGFDVYLGVLPAEMIRGHPPAHPESTMHGGIPAPAFHHVSVAVFDRKTGERVSGVHVEAQVSAEDYAGPRKALEPMLAQGARVYGNYFAFGGTAAHQVRVWVLLPATRAPLVADFEWARS